jgi:transcriptional regulator with XRE-family HTH domain
MPRRSVPVDLSIGERVKARRELRGWSMRHAADRAGVSHTTWGRIERGELRTDRYMIADLAAALECSITDLTGQPYAPADRQLESAHIRAEQVWRAMMANPFGELAAGTSVPAAALRRDAALVRDLYGRCDYAGVLARLADLLPQLHTAAEGQHAKTALTLMVPVYGCAMGSLLNIGYPAQAWLAAERSTEAAQRLDDAVALAVAAANRARVSSYSGAYRPAQAMCDRADDALQHELGAPHALDLSGFLHLARAHHAAGLHDRSGAEAHLAEAAAIAARTGETDAWDLAWGPRNVALWTMAWQLDTGQPGEAMRTAAGVRPAGLPAVRQVYFYLDMARGLADVGQDDDAVRMLLTAERTGAQHTRSSSAARETARAILHRARRDLTTSPLYGLCERLGVAS